MNLRREQQRRAEAFRALHRGDRLLLLPNAWDVPSARVFEDVGFPAVATSSAALAASLGYTDGERIPKRELFAAVRRIARVLSVPLSVDAESGYGESLAQLRVTIRGLVEAGAVGVNLEDTVRAEGRALRSTRDQVARLRSVRTTCGSLGVLLVLNARTDAFMLASGDANARLAEAIRRGQAYEAAGADCLYPMGLTEPSAITGFLHAVTAPVNVMVRRGLPPVAQLERMGVRRLSLGPSAMYATMGLLIRIARELEDKGTYDSLISGAITFDELMTLAVPRTRSIRR